MNRDFILKASITGALFLAPLAASAQSSPKLQNLQTLIESVKRLVELLLPVLVTIALLVFFWGLIKYIREANDPEAAKEGKSIMIYGIIALFVMVSIWGIIRFIGSALDIKQGDTIPVPGVEDKPGGRGGGSNQFGAPVGPGGTVNPDRSINI